MNFRELALEYVRSYGVAEDLPVIRKPSIVYGNPINHQKNLAKWYNDAVSTPKDPIVRDVFLQVAKETAQMFAFLVTKGFTFVRQSSPDSYVGYQDITYDLENSHSLLVYCQNLEHPVFTNEQNFMFRAVHDVFGHALGQCGFTALGEYYAYLNQRTLYSSVAAIGLATELHAQSSWFNYGPYSNLPIKERRFPPQKAVIVPRNYRVGKEVGYANLT